MFLATESDPNQGWRHEFTAMPSDNIIDNTADMQPEFARETADNLTPVMMGLAMGMTDAEVMEDLDINLECLGGLPRSNI
jgi:hypothetical protein